MQADRFLTEKTMEKNKDFQTTYSRLVMLRDRNWQVDLGGQNECEDQLKNTDRMIKSLKYQINSIVSNKSCHLELN